MCLAIPMQVLEASPGLALCEFDGERRQINTLLVGDQIPGTWLLVFLDQAREVITPEEANKVRDALRALDAVTRGDTDVEHLLTDLVDREPRRPDHVQRSGNKDGQRHKPD